MSHTGHENKGNDHQRRDALMLIQILQTCTLRNNWKLLRRICIVMLGLTFSGRCRVRLQPNRHKLCLIKTNIPFSEAKFLRVFKQEINRAIIKNKWINFLSLLYCKFCWPFFGLEKLLGKLWEKWKILRRSSNHKEGQIFLSRMLPAVRKIFKVFYICIVLTMIIYLIICIYLTLFVRGPLLASGGCKKHLVFGSSWVHLGTSDIKGLNLMKIKFIRVICRSSRGKLLC